MEENVYHVECLIMMSFSLYWLLRTGTSESGRRQRMIKDSQLLRSLSIACDQGSRRLSREQTHRLWNVSVVNLSIIYLCHVWATRSEWRREHTANMWAVLCPVDKWNQEKKFSVSPFCSADRHSTHTSWNCTRTIIDEDGDFREK